MRDLTGMEEESDRAGHSATHRTDLEHALFDMPGPDPRIHLLQRRWMPSHES
jgi:hypothetical protein